MLYRFKRYVNTLSDKEHTKREKNIALGYANIALSDILFSSYLVEGDC